MKLVPKIPRATAEISSPRTPPRRQARLAAGLLCGAVALWWLTGALGALLGAHLPDAWERKLGGVGQLIASESPTGELARAQAILDRLVAAAPPLRDLPYRLVTVDLKAANAVALPGGGIGLTPELLDAVTSEEGLAFVLAHELGHHQRRHMVRRLGRGLLQGLFFALLLGQEEVGGPMRAAMDLADAGYSREDEREADEYALRLVHRIYGDTAAAMEFFRHVLEHEGDPVWQRFAGSHPPTRERIEAMTDLLRRLEAGPE